MALIGGTTVIAWSGVLARPRQAGLTAERLGAHRSHGRDGSAL